MEDKQLFTTLDALKSKDKKGAAVQLLSGLDTQAQDEVLQKSGVASPTQAVSDKLWRIIIGTVSAVLGVAALSIIYAVVFKGKTADNLQVVLLIFTSTMTFITGVFVPSPTQKNK